MFRQPVGWNFLHGHPPENVTIVDSGSDIRNAQGNAIFTQTCARLVAVLGQAAAVGAQPM